jgi:hypothetical protein
LWGRRNGRCWTRQKNIVAPMIYGQVLILIAVFLFDPQPIKLGIN